MTPERRQILWTIGISIFLGIVVFAFAIFLVLSGRRHRTRKAHAERAASAAIPVPTPAPQPPPPSGLGIERASADAGTWWQPTTAHQQQQQQQQTSAPAVVVHPQRVGAGDFCWEDPPPPYEASTASASQATGSTSLTELLPARTAERVSPPAVRGLPDPPAMELATMEARAGVGGGVGQAR
jgi:hypothetical protein